MRPTVLNPNSGWIEVQWIPDRLHEVAVQYRRAARVFLKPASPPADPERFLDGLRMSSRPADKLDAAALLVQNLLIDSAGNLVPSPLTEDVQIRRFLRDGNQTINETEVSQYELSRATLLNDSASGGFVFSGKSSPAYLADAGNDYGFATPIHIRGEAPLPVATSLRTRCVSCHGRNLTAVFTFNVHQPEPIPPVIALNPAVNEHADYVAQQKAKREDFKSLH